MPINAINTPIQHPREDQSNEVRRLAATVSPESLRTFTPSLAVIDHSAGSYHFTPEGRKLADFTSGVLVANLGHNPAGWWRRVIGYMGLTDIMDGRIVGAGEFFEAAPLTAYNAITRLETEAARRLLANLTAQPGGARMEQVLWSASGSEAIQKALWAAMARRPGEEMILATRSGFHGKKGLADAITGSENDPERDSRVRFLSFPTDECINLDRRRQPLDLAPYQAELEAAYNEFGSRICCLCSEPYLGGGGSFHPQKEYLQLLEQFCRQHDILLILDEIQANFGRTGPMYAFTHYGIEPDIVCLGKGLGNGVAVSAAVGRADVFASLSFGQCSDTWSANPLSCAAVLATLDEFESTDVLERSATLATVIEQGLRRLAGLDAVANIRGEGVVWGVECGPIGGHSAADVAIACIEACYLGNDQGDAIHLLGPLSGKVIRISPPLVMPSSEAEHYLGVMFTIFAKVSKRLAHG